MKYLFLLAGIALFLGGCASGSDKVNAENIELVNKYIKAVEEMDFEAMVQYHIAQKADIILMKTIWALDLLMGTRSTSSKPLKTGRKM